MNSTIPEHLSRRPEPGRYDFANSGSGRHTQHEITCDVNNCAYNEQRKCTANEIVVGPQYAASTADTVCITFRPA